MKCIILCAGYATRLYPLTQNQPKPLLKIAEKAIIEHILEKIEPLKDIGKIYIVTNDKFYAHFNEWHNAYTKKHSHHFSIKVLNDGTKSNEDRLGSIGDINFVIKKEKINDDILIISGDNLFEFGLLEMHEQFRNGQKSIIALYDVKKVEEARKFGVVMTDEDLRIIHFEEKPKEPESTLASIGIYFYPKDTIKKIQQYLDEGNSRDMPGNFLQWLHKEENVHGHIFDSEKHKWFDIGSHESLEEADEFYKKLRNKGK